MNISVTDALGLFTNEIVAKYSDQQKPKSFGRSYFTEVTTSSKLASFVSERGLNLIATDVARGSQGNLNVFDKSTQNIVFPPYFNELINLVELDSYDMLFTQGVNAKVVWGMFMDEVAKRMNFIMDKIDRRYELQCWQLFNTGIVTLNNGHNIQYGRKAGSLVNPGAGSYWADANVDPITGTLTRGATWLNETGKMAGNTIDVIFSKGAWSAWLANTKVGSNDLKFNNNLTVLANTAVRDSTGKTFLGSTTSGAFNYNFFTYSDFYQGDDGTVYQYLDDKKIIMVPEKTMNTLTYTAVPQKILPGTLPTAGKFKVYAYEDVARDAEFMGVKSAGIPTLVAVDQVYTEQIAA
jgi:hypothetical protein